MLNALNTVQSQIRKRLLNDPFLDSVTPQTLLETVTAYPSRQGKALRPALVLWTCGLFKEPCDGALSIAAAIELFHIWTLVHDDIIDDDDTRRGEPSAHMIAKARALTELGVDHDIKAQRFGTNMAILAGDIQQTWSNALVLDAISNGVSPTVVTAILERLHRVVTPGLLSGEALDVEFELRPIEAIRDDDIMTMLSLKTGLLLRFAAECGAMVGGNCTAHDSPSVNAAGEMAAAAGLAFQLKDDLLGMYAQPGTLGKAVGADLKQGKRTLLFVTAFARVTGNDREYLAYCLGNPMITDTEVREIGELLERCGATDIVRQRADEYVAQARQQWLLLPDNPYRQLLDEWLDFVVARNS